MLEEKSLEIILSILLRYTSGDNYQPFLFKINNTMSQIEIYHDGDHAEHPLNFRNFSSLISLGSIIKIAEILALNANFKVEFQLLIKDSDYEKKGFVHWGTFQFDGLSTSTLSLDDLQSFLKVSTNRGAYLQTSQEFPLHHMENIEYVKKIDLETIEKIFNTDIEFFSNEKAIPEVAKWIRITKKDYLQTRSGFHWSEVNMSFLEAFFIKLWNSKLFIFLLKNASFVLKEMRKKQTDLYQRTPFYFVVHLKMNTPMDFIKIGEIAYEAKYLLGQLGFSTQPLSGVTMPTVIYNLTGQQESMFPEYHQSAYAQLKKIFRTVPEENDLVWFFRTGQPEKRLAPSLRKTIYDSLVK